MEHLYPLCPGATYEGDWFKGSIPLNIVAGSNTMIDSSNSFREFHSLLNPALVVGTNVTLWRSSLATETNGFIEIGDYSYLSNAALVSAKRISIGSRVFIAVGTTIVDSDFHPLDPLKRMEDILALSPTGNRANRPVIGSAEVIIEDDVWIGFNATILKGVRIGKGALIEPGSVVVSDVPAGARFSGNPAKSVS
ncbi:MAG: acyltransferase [Chlorobiaceae bacterium]|nr:acyltransferase [Chlorobiaceae bacterium]